MLTCQRNFYFAQFRTVLGIAPFSIVAEVAEVVRGCLIFHFAEDTDETPTGVLKHHEGVHVGTASPTSHWTRFAEVDYLQE